MTSWAAGEWLCVTQRTRPSQLGIPGASHGGLVAAAAMTQRPYLFRAVVCIAPLLDMVRYEQFGRAGRWKAEYGSVDDIEDFRALLAYSPYHHVRDSVNYPPVLFVSGDADDRCDPAHVRKMAIALQNRPAQSSVVLVDYSAERGHSPTMPLDIRVDALTRRIAFLCRELGVSLPRGESQ